MGDNRRRQEREAGVHDWEWVLKWCVVPTHTRWKHQKRGTTSMVLIEQTDRADKQFINVSLAITGQAESSGEDGRRGGMSTY